MHIVSHGYPATPPTECVLKIVDLVKAGKLKSAEPVSHACQVGSYVSSRLATQEPAQVGDLIVLAADGQDAEFGAALEQLVLSLGGDPTAARLQGSDAAAFPIPPFILSLLIQQLISLAMSKLQSEGGIQAILDAIIKAISEARN